METVIKTNLDLSYLHSVSGGDKLFEKMLLTSAIADIQINIDRLQQAWFNEDTAEISSAAHTLKPVMVIAGMTQLETPCKRIDTLFRDGKFHPEELPTVSFIVDSWNATKPKLEEMVAV